jgi:hypothetical protein
MFIVELPYHLLSSPWTFERELKGIQTDAGNFFANLFQQISFPQEENRELF